MPRIKNIRKVIAPIIEELCQVYEDTNPAIGTDSEWEKLQCAQYAYDLFWQLYGELMIWAQNHIVGYEYARDDAQVAELVAQVSNNGQLHENAHGLELLGAFMSARFPYANVEIEEKCSLIEGQIDENISSSALRKAFIKMLLSREKTSKPFRNRLQQAFEEVEHGQTANLFMPNRTRRRGNPRALDQTKCTIIMHLYYLEAKGFKTYKALEIIGQKIYASPETIRTWKKELSCNDWFRFQWNSARIAGQYEDILLADVEDGSDEGILAHESEEYGPFHNLLFSMYFLEYKKSRYSLEALRKKLKEHRQ